MAVKHNSQYFNEAHKRQRNKVNKNVKESKSAYYKNSISCNKNNPKEMWKYINQLIGKKSKTTSITNIVNSGSSVENKQEIVNLFNEYFSKIGKILSEKVQITDLEYTRDVQFRSETNPNPNRIRSDRIFLDFGSSKIISDRIGSDKVIL